MSENTHQFWWVIFTHQLSHQFCFSFLSHMIITFFFSFFLSFSSPISHLSHTMMSLIYGHEGLIFFVPNINFVVLSFIFYFFLEFGWEANENFYEFLSNDLISRWRCMEFNKKRKKKRRKMKMYGSLLYKNIK
jgi:hypothetical protein